MSSVWPAVAMDAENNSAICRLRKSHVQSQWHTLWYWWMHLRRRYNRPSLWQRYKCTHSRWWLFQWATPLSPHYFYFYYLNWKKEREKYFERTYARPFQPLLYQLHLIRSYHFVLFLKIKKRVLTLGERKRNTFRSERCIHRRPTRCSLSFSFFFFFLVWKLKDSI